LVSLLITMQSVSSAQTAPPESDSNVVSIRRTDAPDWDAVERRYLRALDSAANAKTDPVSQRHVRSRHDLKRLDIEPFRAIAALFDPASRQRRVPSELVRTYRDSAAP